VKKYSVDYYPVSVNQQRSMGLLTNQNDEEDAISDALRERRLKLAQTKVNFQPDAGDFEAEPQRSSFGKHYV
jgi:hypothetical protein